MIINHNMNALNAHRQMAMNTVNSGKSMEKLSSGLRINRAGDDAAGLAISEKMRGQIRGLDQASRNSQDGISMIQTAEGALNETQSILQRMRELATQAANDTNADKDREQIQNEINQLTSEINRIGNTTEFNTKKMLDGGASVAEAGKTEGNTEAAKAVAGKFEATIDLTKITAGEKVVIDGKAFEKVDTAATGKFTTLDELKGLIEKDADLKDKYSVEVSGNKITLTQKEGKESSKEAEIKLTDAAGTGAAADATALTSKTVEKGQSLEEAKTAGTEKAGTTEKAGATDAKATEAKEATAAIIAGTDITTAGAKLTDATTVAMKINGKGVTVTETANLSATDAKDPTKVAEALNKDLKTANLDGDVKAVVSEDGKSISLQSTKTGADASVKLEGTQAELAKLGLKAGEAKGEAAVEATKSEEEEVKGFEAKLQIGANKGQSMTVSIADMRAEALGISMKKPVTETEGTEKAETTEKAGATDAKATEAKEATAAKVEGKDVSAQFSQDLTGMVANKFKLNGQEVTLANVGSLNGTTTAFTMDELSKKLQADIDTVYDGTAHNGVKFTVGKTEDGKGLTITSSVKGEESTVSIEASADTAKLGLTKDATTKAEAKGEAAVEATKPEEKEDGVKFSDKAGVTNGTDDETTEVALNVMDHDSATAAIEAYDNAINTVSTQRSKLGAFQNRLEHTINNLGTSSENLTAAESRIRDVDMAKEMMAFSKNNILSQAAQAMLAQANQQPQGVLQLLR